MAKALYVPPECGPVLPGQRAQNQNQGQGSTQGTGQAQRVNQSLPASSSPQSHSRENIHHVSASSSSSDTIQVTASDNQHQVESASTFGNNLNHVESPAISQGQSRLSLPPALVITDNQATLPSGNSADATCSTFPTHATALDEDPYGQGNETGLTPPVISDNPGPIPLSPRSNQTPAFLNFEAGFKLKISARRCSNGGEDELVVPPDFNDHDVEEKCKFFGRQLREKIARELDTRSRLNGALNVATYGFPVVALLGLGLFYLSRIK